MVRGSGAAWRYRESGLNGEARNWSRRVPRSLSGRHTRHEAPVTLDDRRPPEIGLDEALAKPAEQIPQRRVSGQPLDDRLELWERREPQSPAGTLAVLAGG